MKTRTITPYNETFFDQQVDDSLASARAVVPVVLNLLPARSVVDFGCGRGPWLKACLENGIETVLGLDGDYVSREKLLIPRERFQSVDLQHPIRLERRFDLALCLEVAEHLPASSAQSLIGSLAAAAPVVLFSAALPGQGGTSHVNEQWPPYWERLFADQGMRKFDVVRPMIWSDTSVEWWYRQNIYVYCNNSMADLASLEHFEPELTLVSSEVMFKTNFGHSPRAATALALVRRILSRLSR
jgi:SAM-dependent methyltransferase